MHRKIKVEYRQTLKKYDILDLNETETNTGQICINGRIEDKHGVETNTQTISRNEGTERLIGLAWRRTPDNFDVTDIQRK